MKYDIKKIIYDLKDTTYKVREYLIANKIDPSLEKEVYDDILRHQEIGLCEGCNGWFELGELNEQSECEGCNTLDADE